MSILIGSRNTLYNNFNNQTGFKSISLMLIEQSVDSKRKRLIDIDHSVDSKRKR